MARRIVFTDSGFWKYSWAHLVMSMTESCWWVMQCCLRLCPLRTEISPVSLNLLMMLCTVDDEICKAFAIWHWGTLFWKYSTIYLRTLSQIWEPLPIFTSELRDSASLRNPFIANHVTDLGRYSWKILVLRVSPSDKILIKFLEMWVFPLKIKEKIQVKKKVIQKAS